MSRAKRYPAPGITQPSHTQCEWQPLELYRKMRLFPPQDRGHNIPENEWVLLCHKSSCIQLLNHLYLPKSGTQKSVFWMSDVGIHSTTPSNDSCCLDPEWNDHWWEVLLTELPQVIMDENKNAQCVICLRRKDDQSLKEEMSWTPSSLLFYWVQLTQRYIVCT